MTISRSLAITVNPNLINDLFGKKAKTDHSIKYAICTVNGDFDSFFFAFGKEQRMDELNLLRHVGTSLVKNWGGGFCDNERVLAHIL